MQDHPTTTQSAPKKAEVAVAPPCAMVIFGAGGDLTSAWSPRRSTIW